MTRPPFRFKRFRVEQNGVAHPAGTDGVLLGAWTDISDCKTILDIGTGTGLIALMLAQRSEAHSVEEITGIDIHEPSVKCADQNFRASPWPSRLHAIHSPVQDFAKSKNEKFDLIVSNPPFFSGGQTALNPIRSLGRSTATLKPHALLDAALQLLSPRGRFCTILPPDGGRHLCEQACCQGLYCTRITEVYSRIGKPQERLLLQLEFNPCKFERSRMYIYQEKEVFSNEFRNLTEAFYLDF